MNAIYCRLGKIEPNTLIDSPSDHVSSRMAQIYIPEGHVMISQWDPQIYGFQSKPPTTFIILYLAMRKISSIKHRCNVFLTCLHPCPSLMIFNGSHYYLMEIKIKIYITYKGSIAGRMSHDRWQRKVVTSRHQCYCVPVNHVLNAAGANGCDGVQFFFSFSDSCCFWGVLSTLNMSRHPGPYDKEIEF